MRQIYFALLIIIAGCNHSDISFDQVRWKHHADNIEIIRDDFGVPHIYGKTDADAVFGLLYAQCEDDFNRVEMNYIRAIGRIAEIEGEKAIYNDLRAQLFMTKAHHLYQVWGATVKADDLENKYSILLVSFGNGCGR